VTVPYSARAYREADILAASPSRLVVITYDGMISSLLRARAGIVAGNHDVTLPALGKARAFVGELLAALDRRKGGELASNLASIYVFVLVELQTITKSRNVQRLDTIIELMREMREAFATIANDAAKEPSRSAVA
jgi:flagellar protein FliS